ncbi:MAG: hypothetical protein QOF14_1851 [Hyphomicrobiales bacterium]|jgi:hypothetical protein|nr:hypothetical protein [Hyphomicrobiales bacterium]
MFRKTTTALAAVLMLGSASMAFADDSGPFDGRQNPIIENGSANQQPGFVNVAWRHHARGGNSGSWLNRASQVRDGGY